MSVINDGGGKNGAAKVNVDQHLHTTAIANPLQHYMSHEKEEAYQIHGISAPIAGTVTVLALRNEDPDKDFVITYVRGQVVDNISVVPAATEYWTLEIGKATISGGAGATIVNMNAGSGKSPTATALMTAPTITGTLIETEREYPTSEGDRLVRNKEGTLILPQGHVLAIKFTSASATGTAHARISGFWQIKGE